jgi:hypothetical protein
VIPNEYLEKHYEGDKDPVANFALLTESTNKKLRNMVPRDVLVRPDVSVNAIETQAIKRGSRSPLDSESPKDFINRFMKERAMQLEELRYDAVGLPRPVQSATG